MNHLFKQLRSVKQLQPDTTFAARSRAAILATGQTSWYRVIFRRQLRQTLTLGLALSMAMLLLFVLANVSQLPLNGLSPELMTSLDKQDLNAEKEKAGFQLELAEAKYFKESTNQITRALQSVAQSELSPGASETIRQQAENLDSLIEELTL